MRSALVSIATKIYPYNRAAIPFSPSSLCLAHFFTFLHRPFQLRSWILHLILVGDVQMGPIAHGQLRPSDIHDMYGKRNALHLLRETFFNFHKVSLKCNHL
jgi:hypothetical protein